MNMKELFVAGKKAQATGDMTRALKIYREIARRDANFRPALVRLGEIYARAKRPDLAIGFFERALELKPDPALLFNLGSENFKLDRLKRSEKYLKAALKMDRRLLKAHLLLAFLYRKNNTVDKARVYFQNALKLEPGNRMAALGMAIALSEVGEYQSALAVVQKYLSVHKSDENMLELKAGLLLQLGDTVASYQVYNQLTQTSKKFTSFTDHLTAAREAESEQYKQAFGDLDQKIGEQTKRLQKRIAARRKRLAQTTDLSPTSNGIEGAEDLQAEIKGDLREMVDLSFMHLFNGDSQKAMQFLFQARKLKKEDTQAD